MGVERATISDKITTGSLSQLFRLMLMPQPKQLDFIYPPSGCDTYCLNLAEKVRKAGGIILTNSAPMAIHTEGNRISRIAWPEGEVELESLVWTGSLLDLEKLLNLENHGLDYIALLLYNIELSKPLQRSFQWCYYGEKDICFSRVSNPVNFSEKAVPEGKGSLCVEVTCRMGDPAWKRPGEMQEKIISDLVKTKTIQSDNEVEKIHIERVTDAYPVYDLEYLEKLDSLKDNLKFNNLHLAGRTGLYWYNNMDHSIENAMEVFEDIMSQDK